MTKNEKGLIATHVWRIKQANEAHKKEIDHILLEIRKLTDSPILCEMRKKALSESDNDVG